MKKHIIFLAAALLILFCSSLQAQFLKGLVNTVKQTAESRPNSKASQTTNSTLDKVDNSTNTNSKNTTSSNNGPATGSSSNIASSTSASTSASSTTSSDDEATKGVLGAFAKAAAENPNDTSSADLTMKALGIMAGRTSVSKADSIAAINSYKTASGGSGIHYIYAVITTGGQSKPIRDSSQLYFTAGGEGRMEMRIPVPGMHLNQIITIGRVNARKYSLSLYPESKSYSLNVIDTAQSFKTGETYQVTKIGMENVGGYSCIHARLVSVSHSRFASAPSTTEIWTSTSVPGYDLYSKRLYMQSSQTSMLSALNDAGCAGALVKMVVTGKDYSMEEILLKAGQENLSAALFRIPDGYSESNQNMISHMASSAK